MRVESGPATGDRNYFLLVLVICLGLFAWFMRDWQYGYLATNKEKAAQELTRLRGEETTAADIPQPAIPTTAEFEQVESAIDTGTLDETTLRELMGEPIHTETPQPGITVEYYASYYGVATISRQGLNYQSPTWKLWDHSKEDIEGQFWWGLVPLAAGLYMFYRVIRAVTLRAVVDDEGLLYRNERIPWERMNSLRDYSPKGWIDLYYSAGNREKKLRLDNQKIAEFGPIVDAICEKKGFENEMRHYAEDQAAAEVEDTEAETDAPADATPDSEMPTDETDAQR